jgi:TRAP transporter TAXI family solute receptor
VTEHSPPHTKKEIAQWRKQLLRVQQISWRDLAATLGPVVLISAAAIAATVHFIRPAPPNSLVMAGGAEGSNYRTIAEKYKQILARNGIELTIEPSKGSLDNLNKLVDPDSDVDIALVQSGVTTDGDTSDLVSLGSMFPQPLTIFYRSSKPITRLSELEGKRIAIGGEGTGTRFLALAMLKANGIEPGGKTPLVDLEGETARQALKARQIDAIFLSGDSAGIGTIRELMHTDDVRLFDFVQADGYTRRFRYLSKLTLPAGTFDLGENLPPQALTMLAPSVELLTHSELHPALSDLLIEAAQEVHGKGTLLSDAGEFPAPTQHDYPIGDDAARYYKSGKGFAYQYLPFWLASLVSRAAVILVPILVVLIPGLRYAPNLYGWRVNSRIYKHYGELMTLERAALEPLTSEQRVALVARLDEIEKSIINGKIPGAYADKIYVLRRHIRFARDNLAQNDGAGMSEA